MLKLILLILQTIAIPAAVVPPAAMTLAEWSATHSHKFLTAAVMVPILEQYAEGYRLRNMSFIHPSSKVVEEYQAGTTQSLETLNYGLRSPFGLRYTKLYLIAGLNSTKIFNYTIGESQESKFLGNIKKKYSNGTMFFTIPTDTLPGKYRMRYVSSLFRLPQGEFQAISPVFRVISDSTK